MTRQELKKKRKQIVESKGYREWEPKQENKIVQRKQNQKNAENTRKRIEIEDRQPVNLTNIANPRQRQTQEYFKPNIVIENSTLGNVNKKFLETTLKQEAEEAAVQQTNKLFEKNGEATLSENKFNILDRKRVDRDLSQEELDKLAKMDRKERFEALKGRSDENFLKANLYAQEVKNKQLEENVNKQEGLAKVGGALVYAGNEFVQNTLSSMNEIDAALDHLSGRDNNLKGLETAAAYSEMVSKIGQNVDNKYIQSLGMASEGFGQQMPQILLGAPGTGAIVGGISEFSNSYNEMTLEDPSNREKTILTSVLKGTAAGVLEKTLGLFGKSKLDDISKSQLAGIKNNLVRNVMSTGYDTAGEITEEELENIIGYVIDKAVNDKNITLEQAIKETEATYKQTGLTTVFMSALGLGGNTRSQVNNLRNNLDIIEESNLSGTDKKNLKEWVSTENISNEQLYTQIGKMINENNLSDQILEKSLEKYQAEEKQPTTIENKEVLKTSQQTTLKQAENAQNQSSSQILGNEKYSIKIPNSNYKFEKTGNINEDNLDESMSKYFNNSEATKKLNTTLKKIMNDKNLSIKFDDNITDEAGNVLDGKYENGSITINPNSSKAFEYVATHELTHAIGTKEMLNMVEKYRKSNSEFNSKVETLLKNYNKSELTEEALADVSAELFGTQEFIANVKNTNPNLFQKIYNEIKYLWHQFRGYKNQNQFVEDLYNKWTAAYNSKTELNQDSKYLFAGTNAKNKNISTLKEALKLEEQGKNEQEIFEKTGWFRGNDTKWRFETDDSKISLKNDIELEENEVYYLDEFLNADEIFEAYPELKDDVLIRFKEYDDKRIRGERTKRYALDYEYDEIHINNDVLQDKEELKSVLLHEIQHYIQSKEDFSRGASREYWQDKINDAMRKRDNLLKDMKYYHKEIGYDKYKDELFKKAENKEIDFFDVANLLTEYENNSEHSAILKVLRKAYEEANIEYSRLELQGAESLYRNTAGEQESREVENRMALNEDDRRGKLPFITDEKTVYSDADKVYNIAKGGDTDAILSDERNILSTNTDAKVGNTRNRRYNRNINENEQNGRILQDNKGQDKQGNNKGRNIENNRGIEGLEESSSFNLQKLEERVSGDDLLDAQDFIEEVKSVGAEVDENGYVTVYHQTTSESANKIKQSGKMSAKEDGIFFSTSKNAQQSEGRGTEKIKFKIPAEILQLDDIFDDNADVKIPLKNRNEIIDVSQYIVKENDIEQENNYRGSHQIQNAKRITELDLTDIENRVKKVNGYLSKQDNSDLNKLKKILKSPNEKVKIYRASPVHELNSGDWVTTDKSYAKNVAKENGGKVYEYEIDASELYYPDNVKDLPSLHRLSSFQYVGDVRYSKQNAEWYDYVQDTFKTEGTRTTKEQITKDSDSETITEEGYTPTQKAINYEQRQKNNFKRNMSDMLGISQYNKNNKSIFNDAIDEMQKEYNATGTISQETKDRVFENMYNGLIKEDAAFYNENKEIKNEIRNTTLYISDETKSDITDYADFKRSVFGNVRLSSDKTDMPIDTFYKELSSQRPDLFPESIITISDQLKRIAEVSKSIRKSERNLAAYNNELEAPEYKMWAKNEFEIQTARLQQQFDFINKYNESKQAEFEKKRLPYSRPDVEEIKSIYQNRNEIRKEVEKQERNLLLTEREKAIVNRLLNDEMDVSEIMPGYNKEGIIKSYYARQQLDYLDKEVKRYKQDKKQELYDMSENLIYGIKDWKDKKIGLQYSRETAQRNIRDIMSKNEADRINKELFDPIQENTANQIRFINDYNKQIEELDLDKKAKYEWKDSDGKEIKIDEATLAQLLIEKKIDENYLTQVGADVEKIRNAADTFSRILNEVVDMMDDVYVEFGYAPVERRKNYFPHFIENKPDTLFSKIANALNFSTDVVELPTDIAGRTESFKPGRAFNRNILKRTTEKTDYNALKAIDMYLQGASDIIYHTADIQKLRAFQEAIRDNYRDVEIQKKILEIEENTEMTADERAEKIKEIKENIKTPLPKLVEWLDEYTNLLANKKSSGDRQTEKDLNRKMYTTMQEIEGKIASNLIGGNLSVSLTNIAPLFQAMGTTELGNIFVGMVQTAQNDIRNFNNKGDNFADASDFLTSRRGNELLQKQTVKQNISNVAGIPMQVIDNFVSESIVRAKYRENIKKGMDNDAALKAADTYARNLMADRSKGALPTIFARKNPVSKLMTSFQVEPNNIISNYFKDMKADAETKTQLAYQAVKLSAASFVFNEVLKSIRGGSDVIPNPIGIASRLIALAIANLNDDEEDDLDEIEVLKEIGSDVLGSIPFGTTIANTLSLVGVEGFEDTGKFMTSNALPSVTKLIGLADEEVSPEYKKQTLIEELSKPLIYLGLPTAGSQISKSAKGIKAFVEGGSYKYNKKGERQLQFPVEQNVTNAVKSTVFGKYSLPGGTKYIDEGFKSLNGKETIVYEQSNIDFDELKTYFEYSKKDGVKKKDKINYLESMDISSDDKWNLYKHNIISNTEREDGTSQLSDAEFVINNNMATPEEYMKMYSKAERNEVEFPGTETLQELKDSGLSLKTYMDYKTKLTLGNRKKKAEYEAQNNMPLSKEESEKRKSLNTEEKIALLEKYSDREKALIYENYIGKSDTVYQHLKQLTGNNVRINDYLDYKIADLDSDRKNDGTKKGKAISGSAEKKLVNFLNNSKLSNIERIYIYGQTYELDNSQRQQFQNYIRKLNLPYAEEKEIWLDLSSKNIVEMADGSIRWK